MANNGSSEANDAPAQQAQCFLSANAALIRNKAGRNVASEDRSQRLGPRIQATQRVGGNVDPRLDGTCFNATADFHSSVASDYSSVNDFSNFFHLDNGIEFFHLPQEILRYLVPEVTFYKAYPYPSAGAHGKFGMQYYKIPFNRNRAPRYTDPQTQRDTKVYLRNLRWEHLGGNPAEIDTNIKFQVELSSDEMSNFFLPWWPYRTSIADFAKNKSATGGSSAPDYVKKNFPKTGIRWIDLIQIKDMSTSTNQSIGSTGQSTNKCDERYDSQRAKIMIRVGYKIVKADSETKNTIRSIFTRAHQESTGNSSAMISDENWTNLWDKFTSIVDAQSKMYNLNLLNHEIGVDSNRNVNMTINYVASLEASQRTERADMLNNIFVNKDIRIIEDMLAVARNSLKEVQPESPDPGASEEKKAKIKAQNDKSKDCLKGLEEQVSVLEEAKRNALINAKQLLLDQIRITPHFQRFESTRDMGGWIGPGISPRMSRIYWMAVPSSTLDTSVVFDQVDDLPEVENYTHLGLDRGPDFPSFYGDSELDRKRAWYLPEHLESVEGKYGNITDALEYWELRAALGDEDARRFLEIYAEQNPDYAGPGSPAPLSSDTVGDVDFKLVKFVFFGDIIEAALEIVGYNERLRFQTEDQIKTGMEKGLLSDFYVPTWMETVPGAYAQVGSISDVKSRYIDKMRPGSVRGRNPEYSSEARLSDVPIFGAPRGNTGLPQELSPFISVGSTGVPIKHPRTEEQLYAQSVVGEILMGDVTLPVPSQAGNWTNINQRTVNIADLPISWELFRSWYHNKYVNSNISRMDFRTFATSLINDLLPGAIGNNCEWVHEDEELLQFSLNSFEIEGEDIVYNARTYGPTAQTPVQTVDSSGNIIRRNLWQGMYIRGEDLKNAIEVASDPTTRLGSQLPPIMRPSRPERTPTTNITLFQALPKRNIGKNRTGRQADDAKTGIPHFLLGDSTGISNDFVFTREDLPGLREANLIEGDNSLGFLREKYNLDVRVVGNNLLKPGSLFYVPPDSISKGTNKEARRRYAEFEEPTDINGNEISYSRQLGIGGYFFVVRVQHAVEDVGNNTFKWFTNYEGKWVAFAGEEDRCDPRTETERVYTWEPSAQDLIDLHPDCSGIITIPAPGRLPGAKP